MDWKSIAPWNWFRKEQEREFKNGVLRVTIPKRAVTEEKRRKIEIHHE